MKKLLASLATLAGAAALVGLFIPFVQLKGMEDSAYQGWKVVIGCKESEGGISMKVLEFSFMNMLPFLLVLFGAGAASKKSTALLGVICFAGAAVLFYMAPQFIQLSDLMSLMGDPKDIFELAVGGKVAMYASGAGAVLSLLSMFVSE